jgi:hypothetical protein
MSRGGIGTGVTEKKSLLPTISQRHECAPLGPFAMAVLTADNHNWQAGRRAHRSALPTTRRGACTAPDE